MEFIDRVEGDIAGVRIRLGRFGSPVIQLRREVKRRRFGGPSPADEYMEPWGHTAWRDVRKVDAFDLARYLAELQDPPALTSVKPPGAE